MFCCERTYISIRYGYISTILLRADQHIHMMCVHIDCSYEMYPHIDLKWKISTIYMRMYLDINKRWVTIDCLYENIPAYR